MTAEEIKAELAVAIWIRTSATSPQADEIVEKIDALILARLEELPKTPLPNQLPYT